MRHVVLICVLAMAIVGCSRTATMSWRDFKAEIIDKHPEDFIWYCGSKDGYDYFHLIPYYDQAHPPASGCGESERDYRVPSKDSHLAEPQPYSTNRTLWVSWAQAAGLTHGVTIHEASGPINQMQATAAPSGR
jgi:hypothetical protein